MGSQTITGAGAAKTMTFTTGKGAHLAAGAPPPLRTCLQGSLECMVGVGGEDHQPQNPSQGSAGGSLTVPARLFVPWRDSSVRF